MGASAAEVAEQVGAAVLLVARMIDQLPSAFALPVRHSHLRAYGRSPAHGYHSRVSEFVPSQAMQLGSWVHGIWSGLGKFVGYPCSQRRGKDFDKFKADNPDTTILLMADYDAGKRMAEALDNNADAVRYLTGVKEQTQFFNYNGIDCRATPDVRGENWITELKTTANADPRFWQWHFRKMSYHVQMVMQAIGCSDNGHNIDHYMIVAVESKAPYPVTIFELQERARDEATRTLMLWSERLKACEQSRQWPGYSQAIVPLDVPDEDVELIYPDEGDAE